MPSYIYLEKYTQNASSIKEAANIFAVDIMRSLYGSEITFFTIDSLYPQDESKSFFWLRDSRGGDQHLHIRKID
jgi:hypothetical protein